MTRGVRATDRAVTTFVGLVLLVVGVAAVLWWTGTLADLWPATPDVLVPMQRDDLTGLGWFGPAATAAGAVLAALALWWLLAHLRRTRVGQLALDGSDGSGRLTLDASALADHVAQEARRLPGVVGARGHVDRERGQDVLVSTLQVEPDADLPTLGRDVADLVAQARDVGGTTGLAARTHLAVRRRARGGARVR